MHLGNVAVVLPFALLVACGGSAPEGEDPAANASAPAAETSAPAEAVTEETPAAAPGASDAAQSQAAAPSSTHATASTPAAPAAPAAKAAVAAPASFAICRACHSVEAGKNGVGPTLFAIVGSKAGDVPGYAFSPALKNSGITWDRAALDTWLKAPMKMAPGTKMVMAVPDPGKRREIIDYLETLK